MLRAWLAISALICLPLLTSCGDDDDGRGDMGSACSDSSECHDRCVRGGDWPGGMCTYDCGSDDDCPQGTYCVDREGGICGVGCGDTDDCRDFGFESGYACRSTDRQGHSGDIDVCRGD